MWNRRTSGPLGWEQPLVFPFKTVQLAWLGLFLKIGEDSLTLVYTSISLGGRQFLTKKNINKDFSLQLVHGKVGLL